MVLTQLDVIAFFPHCGHMSRRRCSGSSDELVWSTHFGSKIGVTCEDVPISACYLFIFDHPAKKGVDKENVGIIPFVNND